MSKYILKFIKNLDKEIIKQVRKTKGTRLYFMDHLEQAVICPYCYEPNQLDPPLLCCGEVHAEEAYYSEILDEYFLTNELQNKVQAYVDDCKKERKK